jgi:hypothetical protein
MATWIRRIRHCSMRCVHPNPFGEDIVTPLHGTRLVGAKPQSRHSALWVLFILVKSIVITLPCGLLYAEVLLDEFDSPLAATSPGDYFVQEDGFGPWNARRGVAALPYYTPRPADTAVFMNSAVSQASRLTLGVINSPPYQRNEYLAARYSLEFSYGLPAGPSFDLTEGGKNDTFFLDVAEVFGESRPAGLWLYVTHSYAPGVTVALSTDLAPSITARTVVVPFSAFHDRAGNHATRMDDVRRVELTFFGSGHAYFPRYPDGDWTVSVDRFRVGRMVPEPSSMASIGIACTILIQRLRRMTRDEKRAFVDAEN